ncbi:SPOR domain-containing protein [Motiliproteus sp. SC1-56]|uniref:SPOR domain-containing protein n=1 Tax=Motiliproteus sp. SC1-56 TaxID=2799565 RepID=UPI001A8F74A1|nr:SPOR domain-containing protein [Motiliproteus sp. SC1-56]
MAQDYAHKNRRQRPAAQKVSAKPAPAASGGRWLLGLVTLVALATLGGGLYFLTGVRPDPVATQETVKRQAGETAPSTAKAAPKAPAEPAEKDYRFYQLLPKSEVVPPEVEAYKSTPRSAEEYSQYLLQAGSFRSASDADSLRAKLILQGLPNVTTSRVVSDSGAVWYRVRLGPFPSRSKLNKAYDSLVRLNLQPMRVKLPKGA